MKFAFGTVIYPQVEKFLPDFIKSLQNQTDQQFDLLIVNDGCNILDIDFGELKCTLLSSGGCIIQNRMILISEAVNRHYDWLIFGDSDDFFDINRIAVIKAFTGKYDLISNEIIPLDKEKVLDSKFGKVLGEFSEINQSFLRDKNLFGFSNAACRLSFLRNVTVPSDIVAVDWFLFSKAIQSGAKACFTSKTNTYYRQWDENIIGLNQNTLKFIKTGVKAKYFHYKNMFIADPWYGSELAWLRNLYHESDDEYLINSYFNKVDQHRNDYTFWWENIKNYQVENIKN